eukprot:scaffold3404_cov50-Phaeocystis_antarctica.AAC.2
MAGVAKKNPGFFAILQHMSGIIADGTSGIVNIVLFRALETNKILRGREKKSWERATACCGGGVNAGACACCGHAAPNGALCAAATKRPRGALVRGGAAAVG